MLFRSVNVSEFMRRMSEMNSFYMMGSGPQDVTLIVNTANPAVQALKDAEGEAQNTAANQIYLLALMNYKPLSSEELTAFTATSVALLEKYLKK